ncbi:B3 domain-containing protein Os02g0598200-like isoform X2 [Solanum dulcamara]|uniref:B3 domain-containing protein Os02g0598200-like isoform X2 n=1 Tax=Solanum dulcamara TaxID=45834 RepID=UPI002486922A|nr:B3 domain-containing protein Os02g0598200-like isoform X2 [Solanum dulcamara]
MEWVNETCDECKKDCLLIHGKRVPSFSKAMTDKSCLQVLIFPPKFAQSVSHLTDQETYLEDSSGLRWRVTVCNHNGSLAIRQGWPEFSSEHGLDVDDLLVFHYTPGQHFIVQIFGTNGCEKIMFCCDIDKGKKRARTYLEETTQVELLQTTSVNPVKKKSKTSAASESEKVIYKPNITNFATDVDADTGKRQLTIYVDELLGMIDRDSQHDHEEGRLCLHLSCFELPASKPLPEGTSSRDNGNDNHVETNLTEPHLDVEIENLNSEAQLPKFEAGIRATDMVSKPAEDIPLLGPKDDKSKEASQFGKEYANGNEKIIKSKSVGLGDTPSFPAINYACLVPVNGRDYLELPESWADLLQKPTRGRWIIFLRGLDKRIWPVFYHSRSGVNVLTCGWEKVAAAYGINAEDDCLFQLADKQKHIFDICKI